LLNENPIPGFLMKGICAELFTEQNISACISPAPPMDKAPVPAAA
jgi:hypothetical protein